VLLSIRHGCQSTSLVSRIGSGKKSRNLTSLSPDRTERLKKWRRRDGQALLNIEEHYHVAFINSLGVTNPALSTVLGVYRQSTLG
jgi:hypothetical protein